MSWLGLGLGQLGSDIGTGHDIALGWRQREQDMALRAARQKIEQLMLPLQLAELQQRLKQMGHPQSAGITSTPGGGTAGVTFDPTQGKFGTQPLFPGMDKNAVKQHILGLASQVGTREAQVALQSFANSIDAGEDPAVVLQKANAFLSQYAEKTATPKKVSIQTTTGTGIPYSITDTQGKTWNINDQNLPQDLKAELDSYNRAHKTGLEQQATIEARKNAESLNRAIQVGDINEARKNRQELEKLARRGIAGHSFLRTVENQVAAARAGGGEGTTSGDMLIVEGFMQTMFGIDPKALRGSPKMMEVLLKQGGWDDRATAMMNNALSGGKLSQDVREQILQNSKVQIQSWDQAVRDSAALVDDPSTKKMLERYNQIVGTDVPLAGGNDLSDLGGKPSKGPH